MLQVKILFYDPTTRQDIEGTVKEWDAAPEGKKCHGVLIADSIAAVIIAPTEYTARTITALPFCLTPKSRYNKFIWRLPTETDFRLLLRNRRKVAYALAIVGDSVKSAPYWAQDPSSGEYIRVFANDCSVSRSNKHTARVRFFADYKR